MSLRESVVNESKQLSINAQIELFLFMKNEHVPYMENVNGVFFSLSDMSDDFMFKVFTKIRELKLMEDNSSHLLDHNIENKEEEYDDINRPSTSKRITLDKKTIMTHCNENIVKDFEQFATKVTKKNIHIKYSIAKKKYNKQFINDKKFEDNDLNELKEERYIIP